MNRRYRLLIGTFFLVVTIRAQSFELLPLGVHGGLEENNLSAYLLGQGTSRQFIALDAGTLHAGLQKCARKYFHKGPSETIRENISAYFISHPHLDHLAGLVQNSPSDSKKTIYGLSFTTDAFEKHYFSWDTWANFADRGESPILHKYHLQTMEADVPVRDSATGLKVTAFPLSHSFPGKSSAFLVENSSHQYLLYLGDTGADTIEHQQALRSLWKKVAPLLRAGRLAAIMIEVSYPNSQPDHLLFGHLTPRLLQQELSVLAGYSSATALKNLPVIITHIKPDGNNEAIIKKELESLNPYGIKWIFPRQAKMVKLA